MSVNNEAKSMRYSVFRAGLSARHIARMEPTCTYLPREGVYVRSSCRDAAYQKL